MTLETTNVWFTILCSLGSGLAGSLITMGVTLYFQHKKDKRDYKMQVFRSLIGARNDLIQGHGSTGEFERAINEIFIAFCGCKPVIQAFEEFRKSLGNKDANRTSLLVTMLKAMANDLHIEYQYANDDLFTKPLQIGADAVK